MGGFILVLVVGTALLIGISIGASTALPFVGTLDGNGYVIKNMTVNALVTIVDGYNPRGNAGLFALTVGATIMNLGLENVSIAINDTTQNAYVGGIAGEVAKSAISNCYVAGSISCTAAGRFENAVGGIVGYVQNDISPSNTSVSKCYNAANISLDNKGGTIGIVGGIVGYIDEGGVVVSECFNTGVIGGTGTSISRAGGIVGSGFADAMNCYNTGGVSATGADTVSAGGIWGYNPQYVENCYNSGNAFAQTTSTFQKASAGGIVGDIQGYGQYSTKCVVMSANISALATNFSSKLIGPWSTVVNTSYINYALSGIGGNAVDDTGLEQVGGSRITQAQAKSQSFYQGIGWNFTSIWAMSLEGDGYPVLKWQLPQTYTVTYNANGGTGAPAVQTKIEGTPLTLSSTQPTRTGYTFKGWATSSTATTAQYQPGGSYTTDAAVTLYAVWQANTYSVRYNANGGNGTMANSSHTYGVAKALSANAFTMTERIFGGWAISAGGAVVYSNGQSVSNLTTANGTVVDLYAVWTTVDKSALNSRIAALAGTQKGNYTDATWSTFQTALTSAQAVTGNPNATQEQVDSALTALNNAFSGLQLNKGIFGTNPKWYGAWWHYLLFFLLFGFIWMWF